jgi:hypothetical protein
MHWGTRTAARRVAGAALAAVTLALLALPAAATGATSTFWQGAHGHPFDLLTPVSDDVVWATGTDQSLSLRVGAVRVVDAGTPGYASLLSQSPDPVGVDTVRSAATDSDGSFKPDHLLTADAANGLVAEFDGEGALVWSYGAADHPELVAPVSARRLGDGATLICDRGASRVFIVAKSGALLWQYGLAGAPGAGVDRLSSPTSAAVMPSGDVVICDTGNHRVIVVRRDDYGAAKVDGGFSDASIVWQYGTTGVAGDAVDQLRAPVSAQPVREAKTQEQMMLVCDRAAARVVEVRYGDYAATAPRHGFSDASLVWQYPAAGMQGALGAPACALGAGDSDNVIWIADGGRVLGLATGSIAARLPARAQRFADYATGAAGFAGTLTAPAALAVDRDGRLALADPGAQRVVVIGATADSPSVFSKQLDLGPARRKRFASITCRFAAVPLASVAISYSVDGGPSETLAARFGGAADVSDGAGVATIPLKAQAIGRRIAYQVTFTTGSGACAPVLLSLSIAYEPWTPGKSGTGGGGDSGDRPHSNGSAATSSYPATSGGSGAGSGGGAGGGLGGGSGSGSGAGTGTGTSASASGTGTGSDAAGATGSAGAQMPADVPASQGAGVGGGSTQIVGYRMRVSGTSGGGEGGGASVVHAGLALAPVAAVVLGFVFVFSPSITGRRQLQLFAAWEADVGRPFAAERTHVRPYPRGAPLRGRPPRLR